MHKKYVVFIFIHAYIATMYPNKDNYWFHTDAHQSNRGFSDSAMLALQYNIVLAIKNKFNKEAAFQNFNPGEYHPDRKDLYLGITYVNNVKKVSNPDYEKLSEEEKIQNEKKRKKTNKESPYIPETIALYNNTSIYLEILFKDISGLPSAEAYPNSKIEIDNKWIIRISVQCASNNKAVEYKKKINGIVKSEIKKYKTRTLNNK